MEVDQDQEKEIQDDATTATATATSNQFYLDHMTMNSQQNQFIMESSIVGDADANANVNVNATSSTTTTTNDSTQTADGTTLNLMTQLHQQIEGNDFNQLNFSLEQDQTRSSGGVGVVVTTSVTATSLDQLSLSSSVDRQAPQTPLSNLDTKDDLTLLESGDLESTDDIDDPLGDKDSVSLEDETIHHHLLGQGAAAPSSATSIVNSTLGGVLTEGMSPSFVMNGSNVSTHTFRKTEWDVKKLENYVRLSFGDATPMENMQPALMNRYLKSFFELAKKSDSMDYEPESLIGFMNSFERYLKTKNYSESLLRSETFKESRTVLKKKRELVRSIGKLIRTKTKDTCYLLQFHRNLLKEKGLLNRDNPDCLLAEIYLNNMIYFGEFLKEDKAWRGNLNLVWGDMLLERDAQNGLEYLTLATYAKKSSRSHSSHSTSTTTTTSTTTSTALQIVNGQNIKCEPGSSSPRSIAAPRTKTGTQTSKLRAAAAAAAHQAAAAAEMAPNNLSSSSKRSSSLLSSSNSSSSSISEHRHSATQSNQAVLDLNSPRVYARQPCNFLSP
jgi:hypothetical protein